MSNDILVKSTNHRRAYRKLEASFHKAFSKWYMVRREKRKLSFTLASWGGRVILANGVSPSPKKNYSVGGATHVGQPPTCSNLSVR